MANRRIVNDLSRRKSDPGSWKLASNEAVVAAELPWGTLKVVNNMPIDYSILPAKFVAQNLLLELFSLFERKIQFIANEEPLDKSLNKSFRRENEPYLDNLLKTLNQASEVCLPSILDALIKWYEDQIKNKQRDGQIGEGKDRAQKALLTVNYLFCIVLIELLPEIRFHSADCEQYVNYIVHLSFSQAIARFKEAYGIHAYNNNIIAETFAEVIGSLSQSHARLIQKHFFSLLNDVRKESPMTAATLTTVISLLKTMKFYRIKTSQVSEIEQGVSFLDELASYYLEIDAKQKELKHAAAGLLVEILLPVAAQIKTEANIPALIAFVDRLYAPTSELAGKKQHKMAAYPLLTCLLCISQSKFFLNNWVHFLNATLPNLKNRDTKISRVALESLYRLLWVYIIRNNCEGNTATRTRLESICSSIFPKNQRYVIPRDAPLNIFVKIIHFIAQQKLDFAFKEIIFELLGCQRLNRSSTITINPERMNIGIRALMVIADGLQQKDGPPGMPRTFAPIASGTIQRMRKTYLTRPLTADVARSLGLEQYYLPCRKAFDAIIKTLDTQVGKGFMRISQTKGKEPEDLLASDIKPKLDLFRTCIAAIPRLLPEPMPHYDLIDLIIRMTVHMDEELSQTAYLTLQNLITECVDWREDIIHSYVGFLTNHIQDTFPNLLESTVRFLIQLLCCWKSAIIQERKKENQQTSTTNKNTTFISNSAGVIVPTTSANNVKANEMSSQSDGGATLHQHLSPLMNNASAIALHNVEGFALALLCHTKQMEKRTPFILLREVKIILSLMDNGVHDKPVLTVLDEATSYVINKYIEHVPLAERQSWGQDFISVCDKINHIETDANLVNSDKGNEYLHWDPWACALSGYCEYRFLPEQCPTAVNFAWPALFIRLNACHQFVDPSNPQNENRASLLRSSKSKATTSALCGDALDQSSYLTLWQRYLVMSCALTQPPNQTASILSRSFSPNGNLDSFDSVRSMTASLRVPRSTSAFNCTHLFQKVALMLKWEQKRDIRDAVVLGIGSINPKCFDLFLEDLATRGMIREIQEKKNESNVRRRKRKDSLRIQMIRIIEIAMWRDVLRTSNLIDPNTGQLSNLLMELLNGIKSGVESDLDRDPSILANLRLHFAKTVALMINSVPLDQRKILLSVNVKKELALLFFPWCSTLLAERSQRNQNMGTYESKAVHALMSVLICGQIPDQIKEEAAIGWINIIMNAASEMVQNIREDWLATFLHLNENNPIFLDFVIGRCYDRSTVTAKSFFKSLVILFSKRVYPCDHISLLALCQVYAGDVDISLRHSVGLLIQILKKEFLDDNSSTNLSSTIEINVSQPDSSLNGKSIKNQSRIMPASQSILCRQLSEQYPTLTIQMISELFKRLKESQPRIDLQASILNTIVYWLGNIELIDLNCEITIDDDHSYEKGYGSIEATTLILNNLLYVTAKWPIEHKEIISKLWKTLVQNYSTNLPIVIQYLFVMNSLSPEILIPISKQIVKYLLDGCGDRLVNILVNQLTLMTEQFKYEIIRHDQAPFYCWQQQTNFDNDETNVGENDNSNGKVDNIQDTDEHDNNGLKKLTVSSYNTLFYADVQYLLQTHQPVVHFTRSNLSLFLISELIGANDENDIDWTTHLTTILHVSVLCLDAARPIICRHARKTLINICVLLAPTETNSHQIANLLLHNALQTDRSEMMEKYNGTNSDPSIFYSNGSYNTQIGGDTWSFATEIHSEYRQMLLDSKSVFSNKDELLQALVFCLSEKMDKPLWTSEDISSRGWKSDNSDQLSCFVHHLSQYFDGILPGLLFKWTDTSMHFALSINNRHFASRSFQIASALGQNPTPWIGHILSRLAELAGDHNDDTQCYITHMMLCFQALVPFIKIEHEATGRSSIQSPVSPTGHNRSVSYTPALLSNQTNSPIDGGNVDANNLLKNSPSDSSPWAGKTGIKKDVRHSMLLENEVHGSLVTSTPLNRSKSAATLKVESMASEEGISAFAQLLSIAVAMLESHVDNEYLLALNLIEKILDSVGPDRDQCLQRLEKTIQQLEWNGFNGIVGLVCRGSIYSFGYEIAVSLLVKCVLMLHEPVIASPNSFALIVTTILPYLLNGFDYMTPLCVTAAQTISVYCQDQLQELSKQNPEIQVNDHPLSYLSTMMIQYNDRSFPRDRFQWTKCVINYLIDAVKPNCIQLVVLLSEMLDRCPQSMHMYLLHIIYLILSYGDFTEASPVPLNAQVLRIVSKHLQGSNYKEAARIIKTVVDQWNSISNTQVPPVELGADKRKPRFELYVGSTNVNPTCSVSGGSNNASNAISPSTPRRFTAAGASGNNQPLGSSGPFSTATTGGAGNVDSLRRQNNTIQSKVRERLIGLLTASGMQIGLPKSASFIFTQSSTDLYHDGTNPVGNTGTLQGATSNSAYSSSERISHLDDLEAMSGSSLAAGGEASIATGSFPRVFREFDFLEAEHDSISESTESGFNWLSTIRPPRGIGSNVNGEGDDFIHPGDGEDDDEDDIDEVSDRADLMHGVRIRNNGNRRLSGSNDQNTLKKRHHRPLSNASEFNDVLSDKTPVQSEKPSDESAPSCPNTDDDDDDIEDDDEEDELEEMDEFKSQKSQRGASSMEETASNTYPTGEDAVLAALDAASSIQCQSEFSVQNTSEYNLKKAPIPLECNHHSSGQVEQIWKTLSDTVSKDQDGETTAYCILIFSQLFRECCAKLSLLLRDAGHTMTMTTTATPSSIGLSGNIGNQRDITGYFTHAIDALLKVADCPFLFVTAQFLRSTNLLQPLRDLVDDLFEHYETFYERREQCIRAVNSMKSSFKLMMIGGSTNSSSYSNSYQQEIELSKCLYKLFFQLNQMLHKLQEMIKAIQNSTNSFEYDMSPAVLSLQRELLACMAEMPASESRLSTTSLNLVSRGSQHIDSLVLQMTNKQHKNAIMSLRQLRSQYGSEFGCCDQMDVDVLLVQFCRSHTLRTWAIVGSIQTLDSSCNQLKEISMQFNGLRRTLVTDASTSVRSSRVSSVNESTFSNVGMMH